MYCGQTAGWIKMPLGTEVGLCAGLTVLDGDPALPLQKGHSPPLPANFRPMFIVVKWMDQYATWYGDKPQPRRLCVRWRSTPLSKKGRSPLIFGPHLLWPSGCMDQDATWYRGRPRPTPLRDIVLDGDPAPLPLRGTAPQFSANIRCGQTAR